VTHFQLRSTVPDTFLIREATNEDIAIVAHHRAAMFEAMGSTTPAMVDALIAATESLLREAIPRGEYRGWLAALAAEPERVVAGAGVQIRRVHPFPRRWSDGRVDVAFGRQAIVLNVFIDPQFRRRGIARRLMQQVFAWARAVELDSLVLHAASDGRMLYEELGFAATNEMRFMGDLARLPTIG
jgi:GNAT superfamily N-acetyltransferase